jgi:hypothetical protein
MVTVSEPASTDAARPGKVGQNRTVIARINLMGVSTHEEAVVWTEEIWLWLYPN